MRENWTAQRWSIWMMVVGAGGLYAIFSTNNWMMWRLDKVSLALLAMTLVAGVAHLFDSMKCLSSDDESAPLTSMLAVYATAWRALTRLKWIRKLVGIVALLVIVDKIIASAVTASILMLNPTLRVRFEPRFDLHGMAASALHAATRGLFHLTTPSLGLGFDGYVGAILALGIVVLSVRIFRKLAVSTQDDECAESALFLRRVWPYLSVLCAVIFVNFTTRAITSFMFAVSNGVASHPVVYHQSRWSAIADGMFKEHSHVWQSWHSVEMISATVFGVAVNAFLLGGVIGLFVRLHKGEQATRAAFFHSAVKYFKPIAGVYLVLSIDTLWRWLSILVRNMGITWFPSYGSGGMVETLLQIIVIALMFAPFAVVYEGMEFRDALKHSLILWRQNWRTIASFLSVGVSIVIVPLFIVYALWLGVLEWGGRYSPVLILPSVVESAVWVVMKALLLVAISELYFRLSEQRESAPQ